MFTILVVTMVGYSAVFRIQEPKVFKVDHPFIVVIQDNVDRQQQILFYGRIAEPKQKPFLF